MIRRYRLPVFGFVAIAVLILGPAYWPARAQLGVRWVLNEVTADFAVAEDHPLVKTKFNLYDPVGPTMRQFDQNVNLLPELNVDTYRIELGWGRRSTGVSTHTGVGGTAEKLVYEFAPLDHIVSELRKRDVQLLGSYGYTPTPLQDPSVQVNRDSTPPKDLAKWKEAIVAFARHYREIGMPFGIHEVWNEPDGRAVFFAGKESEYQQLYAATVEAIRSVDPDAVIAGPASAPGLIWSRSFPEFIARNNLPLDVFSYHAYGSGELALEYTNSIVSSLARFPSLSNTALSLDEWHDADCCNWCDNDVRQRYEGASQLLHDFKLFLTRPELASVSWAWFQDPARAAGCMGLVTGDGHRKAVFNAWKIYSMMPVDRARVTVRGPFEAMASSDQHTAGVVVWNRDPYDRWISNVYLRNVPFSKGTVRIYRIDSTHASYGDKAEESLTPVETFPNVDIATWTWKGAIPRNGTMYFAAEDGTNLSELAPAAVARVIRINHYYPARGATKSYADFDRKTWIARLGMMDSPKADEKIGVLAEALPDTLNVAVKVDGRLQKLDVNSLLGVRVDYMVSGKYSKAILFHGPYGGIDLWDAGRNAPMPWGGRAQADKVIALPDIANFQIPVRTYAPAGWAGKAQIAFILQNAGSGTRARIKVRRGAV
jgi:Glycosyl hydrolases family 39